MTTQKPTQTVLALPEPHRFALYPGHIDPETIRKLFPLEAKGKREFEINGTTGCLRLEQGKCYPYKGQWKSWAKWTNEVYIPSYAVLSEGMLTLVHYFRGERTIKAPSGMRFAMDGSGIHVIRKDGMEYHPTQKEFWGPRFASVVRQKMAENYKLRQEQKRKEAADRRLRRVFERDLATTRVSLLDSRRAGNCIEGSLRFAEQKLRLKREEILQAGYLFHVSAKRLLAVANGDKPAVERAIRAAWGRETLVSI